MPAPRLPEYTLSLLIWIVPSVVITLYLHARRVLRANQRKAILVNVVLLGGVGCALDLMFAKLFFVFPDPSMTLRVCPFGIPVEEFVFYVTGFWFILLLYVLCDERFLARYNKPDAAYYRFGARLRRGLYLFVHGKSLALLGLLLLALMGVKRLLNPEGSPFPGYAMFLAVVAYFPFVLFWRLTRRFVNLQALVFTFVVVTLISILWEVTLAFPRGYWNYNHDYMLGVFVPFWNELPIEELTLYVVCTLIVLTYEYSKIVFFRAEGQRVRRSAIRQPRAA